MNKTTLMRALLTLAPEPAFTIAEKLDVSSCTLSKIANAHLTGRRHTLQKAATYLSALLPGGAVVDADLLLTTIRAEDLIKLARYLRVQALKGNVNA